MPYIDGLAIAVPTANKQKFIEQANADGRNRTIRSDFDGENAG